MRGRRRRAAVVLVASMLATMACSAERRTPVALPPAPPSTTDPPRPTRTTRPPRPTTTVAETSVPDVGSEVIPTPPETVPPSSDVPPATSAPASTLAPEPTPWERFDAELADRLIGGGDYAAAVAVAVDGRVVHRAGFGYRVPPAPTPDPVDPAASSVPATTGPVDFGGDQAVPLGAEDRFRIASISKVVTAIVVLQLVEAGQLGLDEPVGDRLAAQLGVTPSDGRMAGITVRQLLAHTAGFPSYRGSFFGGRFDSCPSVAAYGLSRGLAAAPGATYTYSNMNYCLLGLLIEQVAGRSYDAVVTDRLLAPLGIDGMRIAPTFDDDPQSVVHPSVRGRNYMEVLGAAGAWTATPADLVTIMASLDADSPGFHPLSPPMVDLMRTIVPTAEPPSPDGRGYGLGMMVFGDGSYGHTGTIESTHAMVVDRGNGVTWAVLVSGGYPSTTGNLRAIFDDAIAAAGVPLP